MKLLAIIFGLLAVVNVYFVMFAAVPDRLRLAVLVTSFVILGSDFLVYLYCKQGRRLALFAALVAVLIVVPIVWLAWWIERL
jgi:hypothetical protein